MRLVLVGVLLVAGHAMAAAAQTKYGVTVRASEPAELAKAKTYEWASSGASYNKDVHLLIVAAMERELAARGLTQVPPGQGNLVVRYETLGRTDVDVRAKPASDGSLPEQSAGTLDVTLRDRANQRVLFSARMNTPFERDPATIEATVNAATKAIFEKYPPAPKR